MANLKVGSLGDYIREQRSSAQISLRQLAEAAGVSNPYLSQIERGLRKPSADILQQIAKGLRISSEALYVQAGILEDQEGDTEVPTAIRTDATLTERQKQVLVDIYDSFRRENRDAGEGPSRATTKTTKTTKTTAATKTAKSANTVADTANVDNMTETAETAEAAKTKPSAQAANVWDEVTDSPSESPGRSTV